MREKMRWERSLLWLAAAVLAVVLGIGATLALGSRVDASDADVKRVAEEKMALCMEAIRGYKEEEGLELAEEDLFETGLLGDRLTGLTTTLGILEAKRTSAATVMAALAVELLTEAGVKAGDTIGAGFSGSFPGLNLALLCACDAMGVRCIYMASIGASSYGANQPELTFPEMACRLAEDGLISDYPAAVSAGGEMDVGTDMDQDDLASVWEQLSRWEVLRIEIEDYPENLSYRQGIYEADGPLSCFVGVGGGLVTAGHGETDLGQGVIAPDRVGPITEKSGLLERYSASGIPVIQLLNIKKLVADYGLPYDPEEPAEIGASALYYEMSYPAGPALLGIGAALFCLVGYRRQKRRERRAICEEDSEMAVEMVSED
ncbi:MAG: poly-gamma-glutamate system protein [Lachnospiraceae bacterium]|nr:poly-gamma-glutamate system protein [Lachnospiraceae bacterium]